MGKSNYFLSEPSFGQLIKLIPRHLIDDLVRSRGLDSKFVKFKTYDHLVVMLYGCVMRCESLRDLVAGLQANYTKLHHLGLHQVPKRSTISDNNASRDSDFFGDLFHKLVEYYHSLLSDSRNANVKDADSRLLIIDSTTVSLFTEIMKGVGSKPSDGKRKGGAKAHVVLDAAHDLPQVVKLTAAKESDKTIFKTLKLPENSIVTFDKGYRKYQFWHEMTLQNITWVTRPIGDETYVVTKEKLITKEESEDGILEDNEIRLGSGINNNIIIDARIIQYIDPTTTKQLTFITNNKRLSATEITRIYKKRWQIETFFKRLKRHNPLRYFMGDNENAVKIQMWCSLILDFLLQIVRIKYNKKISFANVAAILRQVAMTYFNFLEYVKNPNAIFKQKTNNLFPSLFDT